MLVIYLQGFKSQAMAVTCDTEHKFELCIQLGDYKTAYNLAKEMQVRFTLLEIVIRKLDIIY